MLLQLSTHTVDKDQEESYISDMVATGAALRVNSETKDTALSLKQSKSIRISGITLRWNTHQNHQEVLEKYVSSQFNRKLNTDIPEICLNLTHERNDI